MDEKRGETCFYYPLNFMVNLAEKQLIMVDYCGNFVTDDTWVTLIYFFVVSNKNEIGRHIPQKVRIGDHIPICFVI